MRRGGPGGATAAADGADAAVARPPSDVGENAFENGGEEIVEKVVFINRSSKVVKGGRRFKFSALVVVGDKKGKVGVALGKAAEVADAIRRGGELARTKMVSVSLKDVTIPHEFIRPTAARRFCCARPRPVPASSPARRCVPFWNPPASRMF